MSIHVQIKPSLWQVVAHGQLTERAAGVGQARGQLPEAPRRTRLRSNNHTACHGRLEESLSVWVEDSCVNKLPLPWGDKWTGKRNGGVVSHTGKVWSSQSFTLNSLAELQGP